MAPRRGRDTEIEVVRRMLDLRRESEAEGARPYGAAQIRRRLVDEFPADRVPSVRTIRRHLEELPPDDSGRWRATAADPSEVELVLPVVAHLARTTQGGLRTVTREEARLIRAIRTAAPDLDAGTVWSLTQRYLNAGIESSAEVVAYYDLLLALTPWRTSEAAAAFERIIDRSALPHRDKVLVLIHAKMAKKEEPDDGERTHPQARQSVERRSRRTKRERT